MNYGLQGRTNAHTAISPYTADFQVYRPTHGLAALEFDTTPSGEFWTEFTF